MSESGVTSINDLPQSTDNVKLSIESKVENNANKVNMNEIFKEIQSTTKSGELPTRDIPMNTNQVILDETSKPNYIPKHDYYIDEQDFETEQEIIDKKKKSDNKKESLEVLYEELQVPVLLGVIYFLFQLPIVNQTMAKYISFTFDSDGGINLYGIVFKSVLYAMLYYVLSKVLNNISE